LGIIGNNKIFRSQKSIVKIILNKQKIYPTKDLFNEFKVFTMQQLFYRNALYYIYKFNLIEFTPRYYNTRIKNNLEIPTVRVLKSSRCFSQVGSSSLNDIPVEIINSTSYKIYKHY